MPYSDPQKQRAAKREWARQQRAGRGDAPGEGTPRGTPRGTCAAAVIPLPVRVKTAQDILNLLSETLGEVRADTEAGTMERARVIGYLAGISLRAVETADGAARLEAIENALKLRKDTDTQ